jgi:site-specific DNA-adenine methylase
LAIANVSLHDENPIAALSQLVAWWMGPNGLAGTSVKPWFAQRHTNTGGDPKVRWESFKASIPDLARRLQGCVICNRDFRSVYEDFGDANGLAIYCDPPYLSKKFQYEFDFTEQDHVNLSRLNNSFRKARIVVSYYAEPYDDLFGRGDMLTDLYPPSRWERIEVEMSKNSASANGKAKRATEILLVNRRG